VLDCTSFPRITTSSLIFALTSRICHPSPTGTFPLPARLGCLFFPFYFLSYPSQPLRRYLTGPPVGMTPNESFSFSSPNTSCLLGLFPTPKGRFTFAPLSPLWDEDAPLSPPGYSPAPIEECMRASVLLPNHPGSPVPTWPALFWART